MVQVDITWNQSGPRTWHGRVGVERMMSRAAPVVGGEIERVPEYHQCDCNISCTMGKKGASTCRDRPSWKKENEMLESSTRWSGNPEWVCVKRWTKSVSQNRMRVSVAMPAYAALKEQTQKEPETKHNEETSSQEFQGDATTEERSEIQASRP